VLLRFKPAFLAWKTGQAIDSGSANGACVAFFADETGKAWLTWIALKKAGLEDAFKAYRLAFNAWKAWQANGA
jgi:hypothetical protein